MKKDIIQVLCQEINSKLIWISSKYFKRSDGTEVKNIDQAITQYAYIRFKIYLFQDDIKNIKDVLINFGDPLGQWSELPIVAESKKKGGKAYDASSLPFPLEEKQMMIIGRLLYHPLEATIFITTGVGGSGKSTYLNIIRQLFDNDCANSSLTDLANEFNVAEAVKHRLICSDEIGKGSTDEEILKKISAKNAMTINPKNKTPYEVRCQSSIFYCCNNEPQFDLSDSGILRRIVYYKRDTPIRNPKEGLDCKTYDHDQLLEVARQALYIDIKYGNTWKDYFLLETHDVLKRKNSVWNLRKYQLYDDYQSECRRQNLKPFSMPRWAEMKSLFEDWEKSDRELQRNLIDDKDLPF